MRSLFNGLGHFVRADDVYESELDPLRITQSYHEPDAEGHESWDDEYDEIGPAQYAPVPAGYDYGEEYIAEDADDDVPDTHRDF